MQERKRALSASSACNRAEALWRGGQLAGPPESVSIYQVYYDLPRQRGPARIAAWALEIEPRLASELSSTRGRWTASATMDPLRTGHKVLWPRAVVAHGTTVWDCKHAEEVVDQIPTTVAFIELPNTASFAHHPRLAARKDATAGTKAVVGEGMISTPSLAGCASADTLLQHTLEAMEQGRAYLPGGPLIEPAPLVDVLKDINGVLAPLPVFDSLSMRTESLKSESTGTESMDTESMVAREVQRMLSIGAPFVLRNHHAAALLTRDGKWRNPVRGAASSFVAVLQQCACHVTILSCMHAYACSIPCACLRMLHQLPTLRLRFATCILRSARMRAISMSSRGGRCSIATQVYFRTVRWTRKSIATRYAHFRRRAAHLIQGEGSVAPCIAHAV